MINTNKTKKAQLKHHGNPVMGGAGAFGLIGGGNLVSAGKQILKGAKGGANLVSAGKQFLNSPHINAVKGAINSIKNVLKGSKNSTTKTTGVMKEAFKKQNKKNPFSSEEKKEAMNLLTKSKPRTTSLPNPIPKNTKAYNELQYPMGKKAFSQTPKSKPVNYSGPNPANKIGAGGNSYPR